jgi:hypothetical protein
LSKGAAAVQEIYRIEPWGRNFALYDPAGELVCVTVYRKGAMEVVRRLGGIVAPKPRRTKPACPIAYAI